MDTMGFYDQNDNLANPGDPMAEVRRQVLAQMGEPSAAETPAAADTGGPRTSPDYASPEPAPSAPEAPVYAAPAPSDATALAPGSQPSPAGVGAPGNATNAIGDFYGKWLGRAPEAGAIDFWMNNARTQGLSLSDVENIIANSPEAKAYAARNAPAAAAAGGTSTAQATAPVGGSGGYGIQNGTAVPPQDTSWRDSIRKIVMSRLQQDQNPIDENSPQIVAALNASKDQLTRQNTTERNALAERLYGQGAGLNTDAITQQIQQSNERTGVAQGSLKAQLIMSAYKDRATELNHLLDLATQSGDTETAQQIQITLANLQAALTREGLGTNLAEFNAQLSQNAVLAGLNG